MKALVIKIRDAGIFKDPRISKTLDRVMDMRGKTSRYDKDRCAPYIKIPAGKLGIKHIANLLRVFWGERPVPTLRKVYDVFKGDPYFEDLAKRVRVRIESPVLPVDKFHKDSFYPEEATTVRKCVKDSWYTATKPYFLDDKYVQVKGGVLYPDRLRRFIGKELYASFVSLVSSFGSMATIQEGLELLNRHKDDGNVIAFCRACSESGKKSLSNIILNNVDKGITFHASPSCPLNLLMSSQGAPEIIEKFNATLYVPVTEEDLTRINESTGIATFLEGGLAVIESCDEDWSEILEIDTELTVEGELCI